MKSISYIIVVLVSFMAISQGHSQQNPTTPQDFKQDKSQVQIIISDQITAFSDLDVDRAYRHASQSIKSIFPNSKAFC